MTRAEDTDTQDATSALTWRCAQAGLWVASAPTGASAGIIHENWGQGFQVTEALGRDLGVFSTLDAAKQALVDDV
ncbi:hypothetical protein [Herbiconiux sp. YIM B11900]|uniref:hypothetical protein n=1 Tax=Herbiconiux sp. YIM B11900 TaxID=3404131 RepID=UPI003F83D97F